jgi:hypothetical protein
LNRLRVIRIFSVTLLLIARSSSLSALEFAPGISLSYFEYTEFPLSIQVEQMAFTGQLQAIQPLAPPWLTVSGKIYGTLATIAQWPSETTSPRFFGAESKLNTLFNVGSFFRAGVNLGVYFWTMYVADDPYGIENLSSPLVEFRIEFPKLLPRQLSFEFKLAPLSVSFGSIDTRNREIALTTRYNLFEQPSPSKSVDLILELSQIQFRANVGNAQNQIDYFSGSLGIQSFL